MKNQLCLYFLLIQLSGFSQVNLILNPDFDGNPNSSITCVHIEPNNIDGYTDNKNRWTYVPSWDMPDRKGIIGKIPTPDRLCDDPAKQTNSFIPNTGILRTVVWTDYYEYATGQLKSPLNIGNRYYYEYYIRTAGSVQQVQNPYFLGFKLSKEKAKQRGIGKHELILNGMLVTMNNTVTVSPNWQKISGEILALENYSWITIGAFDYQGEKLYLHWDHFSLVDLGPIESPCPPVKRIQNTTHYGGALYEASSTLRSGFAVGAPFPATTGTVNVATWGNVVYKAGDEVNLEPGFQTQYGAEFLGYIAGCSENPCQGASSLADLEYSFCDDYAHTLTSGFQAQQHYSIRWSPTTHLSDPTVQAPVFEPDQPSGTMAYTVTYSDPCGNSGQQLVYVSWTTMGGAPTLSLSNVVKNEYDLAFTINVHSESEWVEVILKEKPSGTVIHTSGKMYASVDYTGTDLEVAFPCGLTSICKDYLVEIRTKNKCHSTILQHIEHWDRSSYCNPKPQLLHKPNVFTPNGDGVNDKLCFTGCGYESYTFRIFNQWGNELISGYGDVCNGKTCIWDGGDSPAEVYQVEYTLIGCGEKLDVDLYNVTLIR